MVDYGMTPMQAIQSATWVGAQALGIEGEVGQIAPGYAADIIAVSGDPLANVRAFADVGFVMKGGEVYKQ
jgi:imidazolonepropionase-like amidohydrolase